MPDGFGQPALSQQPSMDAFICMIDLQEPFRGGDIQFSFLIVYDCKDDHSRYSLTGVAFLLIARSIISAPPLPASGCIGMWKLPRPSARRFLSQRGTFSYILDDDDEKEKK